LRAKSLCFAFDMRYATLRLTTAVALWTLAAVSMYTAVRFGY